MLNTATYLQINNNAFILFFFFQHPIKDDDMLITVLATEATVVKTRMLVGKNNVSTASRGQPLTVTILVLATALVLLGCK